MNTSIKWPESLPQHILQNNYALKRKDQTITTQFDGGLARKRPRAIKLPDNCTVSWNFDLGEYDIFIGWYEHILKRGALKFIIKLPFNGQYREVLAYENAPFTETPTSPGRVMISWELSVIPPIQYSADEMVALMIADFATIADMGNDAGVIATNCKGGVDILSRCVAGVANG